MRSRKPPVCLAIFNGVKLLFENGVAAKPDQGQIWFSEIQIGLNRIIPSVQEVIHNATTDT